MSLATTPVTTGSLLGHLALHYQPGDEQPARRLLELMGCTLVDNGPAPGRDGFCTVLLDGDETRRADNIMFLSCMPPEQFELELAIRTALGCGTSGESSFVGRIDVVKYRPRPGGITDTDDAAVAARIAAPGVFNGLEPESFGCSR